MNKSKNLFYHKNICSDDFCSAFLGRALNQHIKSSLIRTVLLSSDLVNSFNPFGWSCWPSYCSRALLIFIKSQQSIKTAHGFLDWDLLWTSLTLLFNKCACSHDNVLFGSITPAASFHHTLLKCHGLIRCQFNRDGVATNWKFLSSGLFR